MIHAILALVALVLAYAATAAWLKVTRNLTFHQALLYTPLKIACRIDDSSIAEVQKAGPAVVYVIAHQSKIDPALMLSLLPSDTLHILDVESARKAWLEPWRELARTISFNAEHLFISRRLVRHLRGRGRLAVYLPAVEYPMPPSLLSLYRAVARITGRGDASIVTIHVHGYRAGPHDVVRADAVHFGLIPKLRIVALPPVKLSDLVGQTTTTPSSALIERVREAAAPTRAT